MDTNTSTDVKQKNQRPLLSQDDGTSGLRQILADSFILYMKSYAVHWNYEGLNFFSVHKLTEEHYENLAEAIDEFAERIRAKGASAPVSMRSILNKTHLDEASYPEDASDHHALEELVKGHLALAQTCNEEAEKLDESGDGFSADMAYGRAGFHEKAAWMLKSLLGH